MLMAIPDGSGEGREGAQPPPMSERSTPGSSERLRGYASPGVGGLATRPGECRRACAEFMQMYAGDILNK